MGYLFLLIAIVFEVIGTTLMKMSNGFTVLAPSIGTIIAYVICFGTFAQALKTIEVGIAYATWSAVGLIIIATIGIIFFNESLNIPKVILLAMIIIGVVGLNLYGVKH